MPDNVAPMVDDIPDPEDRERGEEREANLSERGEGTHEEQISPDAEQRAGETRSEESSRDLERPDEG